MSYVSKKIRVRYVLNTDGGDRYVAKGTPGAKRVKEKSADYYGFWRDGSGGGGERVRVVGQEDREGARGTWPASSRTEPGAG